MFIDESYSFILLLINKKFQRAQQIMGRSKSKRSKDSIKKKEEIVRPSKQKMIKFNFSQDNLKCFMNDKHPKTERKHASSKYDFNMTDSKKHEQARQEKQAIEAYHESLNRSCQPQPFLSASNQILEQIEKNGLKCVWGQIQQTKTEVSNEEEWEQKELLNQTFSESSSSYGKNLSHASTIDRYSGYFSQTLRGYPQPTIILTYGNESYIDQIPMVTSEYIMSEKIRYYDNTVFTINPMSIGHDPRTTLMIKNIPNKYTIQDLSNQIDQNFDNSYDFLYLPCDIKNNCNVGYGFINFVNTEILLEFYKRFHNKKWLKFRSDKICMLTYARLQGLSSLIEHFQNSKVLNHKDKRYQPIIKTIRECKKIEDLIKQQKNEQL